MNRPFPKMTAHSGCMDLPDNTIASAAMGLKLGADIIEDDIRITRDGILVLAHDDKIHDSQGKEDFLISKMNYSELCELDIHTHHGVEGQTIRLAKLESLLQLMKASGKMLNLDLKVDECIQPVSYMVEYYQMLDKVILSGCGAERALKVNQANPRLQKLLNAEIDLFLTLEYQTAVEITCEHALTAGCFGINIEYRLVRPELLAAASMRNLPIWVWTVNDVAEMHRLVDMGVYSITSRNIAALAELKRTWINQAAN